MAGQESHDGVRRSTVFSLLAEVVRVAATAGLALYLIRALGPTGYGLYALALGVGRLAGVAADLGVSMSTSRFVAERVGDQTRLADVVRDGLRLSVVFGGAAAVLLAALAGPIADAYDLPELVDPLRAIALVTLTQTVFQVLVSVSIGMRRNAVQARLYGIEGFTETAAAVTFVALGGGAAAALLGRSLGFGVASAIGLVMLVRALGPRVLPRVRGAGNTRQILGYARSTLVLNAAFTLFSQIDVLLVTAYLGVVAAGEFQAPGRLMLLVMLVGQAVSNAVAPRVARHVEEPRNLIEFVAALRVLIVIGLLAGTALMVWSQPIVRLTLGSDYDESAHVLLAAGPFVLMGVLGPIATVSLNYLGQAGRRVPITMAVVALQVVLDILLIPPFGIVGPMLATNLTFGIYLAVHFRLLARTLPIDFAPVVRTLLRAVPAAAAMAGVLALIGTGPELSMTQWAAGAVLGPSAFLTGLLVLGAVQRQDLETLRAAATRKRKDR